MVVSPELRPIINITNTATKQEMLHKRKLLIAEDDDDDFDFLNSAILTICKTVEILRTKDGITLSSLLQTSFKVDMILLDISMPYKSGISCLREIRSNPQLASTKVVMYSTCCTEPHIDQCYELGADFYLQKASTFAAIVQQFECLFASINFQDNQKGYQTDVVLSRNNYLQ